MSVGMPDERLVFIDLETAGGEPWRPIMQLAAVAVNSDLRVLDTLEAKLHFDDSFADPNTLRGSRYCAAQWRREARPVHEVLHEFSALLRRHATVDQLSNTGTVYQVAQLVAHNAAFDALFLKNWFQRFSEFLPASPRVLCTMQRAIWLFHENKQLTPPNDFKLATLCEYFGVSYPKEHAHDALADVEATLALYRAMGEGTKSLSETQ